MIGCSRAGVSSFVIGQLCSNKFLGNILSLRNPRLHSFRDQDGYTYSSSMFNRPDQWTPTGAYKAIPLQRYGTATHTHQLLAMLPMPAEGTTGQGNAQLGAHATPTREWDSLRKTAQSQRAKTPTKPDRGQATEGATNWKTRSRRTDQIGERVSITLKIKDVRPVITHGKCRKDYRDRTWHLCQGAPNWRHLEGESEDTARQGKTTATGSLKGHVTVRRNSHARQPTKALTGVRGRGWVGTS